MTKKTTSLARELQAGRLGTSSVAKLVHYLQVHFTSDLRYHDPLRPKRRPKQANH